MNHKDGRVTRGERRRAGKLAIEKARAAGKQVGTPVRRRQGITGDLYCPRCRQIRPPETGFSYAYQRPARRSIYCRSCEVNRVMAWKARYRAARDAALAAQMPVFPVGPLGPVSPFEEG